MANEFGIGAVGSDALGPGFGDSNPYLPIPGLEPPWQHQWISSETIKTVTTAAGSHLDCPPLTLTGQSIFVPQIDISDQLQNYLNQQPCEPAPTQHPKIDTFFAWYYRQDKVEFWARVLCVAWYAAYLLGVT